MSAEQAFEPFRADHRQLLVWLDEIETVIQVSGPYGISPLTAAALNELVDFVEAQFATHMRAEEEVLYPSLEELFPEAAPSLTPLRAQHGELRTMLMRLRAVLGEPPSAGRDEQISVQVRDFVDLLRIHIHNEEAAVFGVAARVLTPASIERIEASVAAHFRRTRPAIEVRPTMKGRDS